jgi:hypothetical protein
MSEQKFDLTYAKDGRQQKMTITRDNEVDALLDLWSYLLKQKVEHLPVAKIVARAGSAKSQEKEW